MGAGDSSDYEPFLPADSASRAGTTAARVPWAGPAPPSNSNSNSAVSSSPAVLSPGSSVSSGHLEELLEKLHVGRPLPGAAAAGSRRLVFSDVSSDDEADAPVWRPMQPGGRVAAPARRRRGVEGLQVPEGGGDLAAGPGQGTAASRGGVAEVTDLLSPSSSSDSSDEGGPWSVFRPTTAQRRRQVVEDSSSSSSDEEDADYDADRSPSPRSSPPPRRALPPYFAAIGPLQSIQLNSPPKPTQKPPPPKAAATGPTAAAAAPAPAAPKATPQRPPGVRSCGGGGGSSAAKLPQSAAAFKRQREQLARELFQEYNRRVFGGRLPADLGISWNNRLTTTAGLTHYRRDLPPEPYAPPRYAARIELSSKVVDAPSKLERTLCHEMCHVAAWLLDHTAKPPHGAVFKKWADAAMRALPHLDISTCHSYDIFYAFRWQCSNPACGQRYGRHSNSIDVNKKVCGDCKARLVFLGKFQQDGTPAKQRQPSAFSLFVKENFQQARERCPPGTPHGEVMKQLSGLWAAKQGVGVGRQGGGSSCGGGREVGASSGGIVSFVD